MKYLALKVPGYNEIAPPDPSIPSGGTNEVNKILAVGLGIFIVVGVMTCLVMIIWGGFMWSTSGGDKQKLDRARKAIIYSIVGLGIMIFALAIITAVSTMLGIHYFSIN